MSDVYKDYINTSGENAMIYLYLKEHKTTGLKYLGQTSQDPFKYKGSGKYWRRHLREHGDDVNTIILGEYNSIEELKIDGEYYSSLWNIVESDEWANLIPESGDGISDPRVCEAYIEKWKQGAFSHHKNLGRIPTDKERQSMKQGWAMLKEDGYIPWNKGIRYDEDRLSKLRVPHPKAQGKPQSDAHIESRKKALKGRKPGFVNKLHTDDTKQQQRDAALKREKKQCPHCGKISAINTYARWHGDNCKIK